MSDYVGPGLPISKDGFEEAVSEIGAPSEALWSVLSVETLGSGYLRDRRPKILFERHVFHRLTGGIYDAKNADISAPTAGGYGAGGTNQYLRLNAAISLDEDAALSSASWGLGQIMGSNFATAGFDSVDAMVRSFVASEDNQLAGMASFIRKSGLGPMLASANWAKFAARYNGPNYAANNYDSRLAQAFNSYKVRGMPDLSVRAAQTYLNYLGYKLAIDGWMGPATAAAIKAFRVSIHDTVTSPDVTADLIAKLVEAVSGASAP